MSGAKTVAIIGAGPVGLAAAAHVMERGLRRSYLRLVTISDTPCANGAMCNCSRRGNTTSTARRVCWRTTGWNSPEPDLYPTGAEMVERYLEPLATQAALKPHIRTSSRVTEITRVGFDKLKTKGREAAPFEIRYQNGQGPREHPGPDAMIDASGTWHCAEPGGREWPRHRRERGADQIAYDMPDVLGKDRTRYGGKTIAVLGAGHSAIGTLTDLAKLTEQAPEAPTDMAAARKRSREGVWRGCERQAGGPW